MHMGIKGLTVRPAAITQSFISPSNFSLRSVINYALKYALVLYSSRLLLREHRGAVDSQDFMDEQFGLSASETTALLGVHTLGRGRMANGKFNGKWVPEHTAKNPNSSPINLDNTYFIELVREDYSGGE